jgi:mannose/cellobiose epimerase-like protein (N-acyl-D-glucosamine 2-epimerase family)
MPQKKQAPPKALPGDVVQITATTHDLRGTLAIVSEVGRRHVGVNVGAIGGDGRVVTAYQRLRHDAFAIIGAAALLTPEVQKARVNAVETARLVAEEARNG